MDERTKALVERLLQLERIAQQATPGPWCAESLGEKGDGSNVIGVAFGPDDQNAERPLSGWLSPFDKDGNEIDYYRDEEVATCEHQNRNSGPNATYIMTFDPPMVLAMIATIRAQAEQLAAAEAKLAALLSANGCDVLGALDAWHNEPSEVHNAMSAALAVACAKYEAVVAAARALKFGAYPAHGSGFVIQVTDGSINSLAHALSALEPAREANDGNS